MHRGGNTWKGELESTFKLRGRGCTLGSACRGNKETRERSFLSFSLPVWYGGRGGSVGMTTRTSTLKNYIHTLPPFPFPTPRCTSSSSFCSCSSVCAGLNFTCIEAASTQGVHFNDCVPCVWRHLLGVLRTRHCVCVCLFLSLSDNWLQKCLSPPSLCIVLICIVLLSLLVFQHRANKEKKKTRQRIERNGSDARRHFPRRLEFIRHRRRIISGDYYFPTSLYFVGVTRIERSKGIELTHC